MKRVWLLAGAGLFAALAAQPALAGSAAHSWSGCYVGAHVGRLWGDVDHKVDGTSTASYQRDVTFSAVTAGAHAGCSYQTGRFVLGVEGDFSWAPVDDNVLAFSLGSTRQYWHDQFDRYATLRARLGVAEDRWHIYGTAGVAFSNLDLSFEDIRDGILEDRFARKSTKGWVAGAGLEYAIQPEWIARIEYLYHRFDSRLLYIEGNQFFFRADKPRFHVVRVGIARRFGPQP